MEKTVHVAGAVAGWFPVVFAYSILAFAYYGYVVSILGMPGGAAVATAEVALS